MILPVFNGERWLATSVSSILLQEDVDFEVVAINDGSTDRSADILDGFASSRLRVIHNTVNLGLINSINLAIQSTDADMIARHDQDDVALPGRLKIQSRILGANGAASLLGARAYTMTHDGAVSRKPLKYALSDADIRFRMFFGNPFLHSSVMFRRDALEEAGGYRMQPWGAFPEDYDLWSRMMAVGTALNLREPLVVYRQHSRGLSRLKKLEIGHGSREVASRYFLSTGGSSKDLADFQELYGALHRWNVDPIGPRQFARGVGLVRSLSEASQRLSPTQQAVSRGEVARVLLRYGRAGVLAQGMREPAKKRPVLADSVD